MTLPCNNALFLLQQSAIILFTALQVEIISVDKSYSTNTKVMDPNYNPKVATWGVFERPANISEAYGGGRTIKAGTPLEDAAATHARKERMAAALARYQNQNQTAVLHDAQRMSQIE